MKVWNRLTIISIGFIIVLTMILNIVLKNMQDDVIPNEKLVEINRLYHRLEQGEEVEDTTSTGITIQYIRAEELHLNTYLNHAEKRVVVLPAGKGDFYQFRYEVRRFPDAIFWFVNSILCMAVIVLCVMRAFVQRQIIQPFHQLSHIAEALRNRDYTYELPQQKYKLFGKFLWAIDVMKEELHAHEEKEIQLMKEKNVLIASMSHDIKTPLSNIRLYSDAFELGLYPEAIIHQRIHENCDKIDHYVNDIITTNHEELFNFEVQMQEVYLHDVWQILKQEQERIEIAMIQYNQDTCEDRLIHTDLYRLKEVLNNVFDNAIKYGDKTWIHVSFYCEDHHQIICIENAGAGVDENDTNAIFQSFYRGNNITDQKGNGLGLYICKQLLKKMDGDIFMSQQQGRISFHIVLGAA